MRRGKNYFVTLLIIIFLWLSFAFLLLYIEPVMVRDFLIPGFYLPFFINLFLALFFTLAVVLGKSSRGLIYTIAVVVFLLLRLWKLGNWLNLILIAAIAFVLDNFFTKKPFYDRNTS